jgi:maltose alpha-D-glucosyltransferase / alpha-amylase
MLAHAWQSHAAGTPVLYSATRSVGDTFTCAIVAAFGRPFSGHFDRIGGFSRPDPAALALASIMGTPFGYGAVNVVAQSGDPHSLLNWMQRCSQSAAAIRRLAAAGARCSTLRTIRSWPI